MKYTRPLFLAAALILLPMIFARLCWALPFTDAESAPSYGNGLQDIQLMMRGIIMGLALLSMFYIRGRFRLKVTRALAAPLISIIPALVLVLAKLVENWGPALHGVVQGIIWISGVRGVSPLYYICGSSFVLMTYINFMEHR